MKNKKNVMLYAALLILIFHLWVNITERTSNLFQYENFIRLICYIGVDIFFFISAYSISKKEIKDYKKFILSRLDKVYLPFIIFAIIQFFYKGWKIKTLLLTITSANLFIKGGGSFLWFAPAIMLMYLVLPLLNKKKNIYTVIFPFIVWLILALLATYTTNNQLLIFINRIPIILLGSIISKYNIFEKLNKKLYIGIAIILFILGNVILYNTMTYNFEYIYDIKYILSIPLVLGSIMLIDLIPSNKVSDILGSITFEVYAVQMIIGFDLVSYLLKITKNIVLINISSIILIFTISYIINYIYTFIRKKVVVK